MEIEGIIKAADHAAQQSDRWLFMVMLILFIVSVAFIIKWFIHSHSQLGNRLTDMTDRHIASMEKLGEIVAETKGVIQSNTEAMKDLKAVTSDCHAMSSLRERRNQ